VKLVNNPSNYTFKAKLLNGAPRQFGMIFLRLIPSRHLNSDSHTEHPGFIDCAHEIPDNTIAFRGVPTEAGTHSSNGD